MKTYTISLKGDVAQEAEERARRDNRTMSELVGEALHCYNVDQPFNSFDEIWGYAATRNPRGYIEEDVPRLIREVREEMDVEACVESTAATKE